MNWKYLIILGVLFMLMGNLVAPLVQIGFTKISLDLIASVGVCMFIIGSIRAVLAWFKWAKTKS